MGQQFSLNFKLAAITGVAILIGMICLTACNSSSEANEEILIGIEPDDIPLLVDTAEPDPTQTGISSLDVLNETWQVKQMIPLYPDIAPDEEIAARYGLIGVFKLVVPANTDLEQMIAAYTADSHVQYAELNKSAQINE